MYWKRTGSAQITSFGSCRRFYGDFEYFDEAPLSPWAQTERNPVEWDFYRNQNVRFDVDFIAKRNVSLGTGSAKNGLDILFEERP